MFGEIEFPKRVAVRALGDPWLSGGARECLALSTELWRKMRCFDRLPLRPSSLDIDSLANSTVKVAPVLIMIYDLITPSDIFVFMRYAVIMQIVVVLVRVAFIAMGMRDAIVVQEVINSSSIVMMVFIVSLR